jgi:hypothetical protein
MPNAGARAKVGFWNSYIRPLVHQKTTYPSLKALPGTDSFVGSKFCSERLQESQSHLSRRDRQEYLGLSFEPKQIFPGISELTCKNTDCLQDVS